MPSFNHTITIRKALSRAVIIITSLSIFLSVAVSTYLDFQTQKENITQQLTTFSKIIAFSSSAHIIFEDNSAQEKLLSSYKAVPAIKNIHIYSVDQYSGEITFFSSYDADDATPLPSQTAKLTENITSAILGDYIEIVVPVKKSDFLTGYVYMRGGLEELNEHFRNRLTIDFFVAIVILAIVLLVTLSLQRRFSRPIEALSVLVKDVAKNKNYDVTAPRAVIAELDLLGSSLNSLFARTLAQIERQKKDEQEIRQLNQNLEAKVNHRTEALKEANQELLSTLERMHQYQTQLVENEKMASLGQMVAGVAHEVNTPIGLGVTGSTLLKDKFEEVKSDFDKKTLTAKKMDKFLNDGIENLELIYRNLNRAAELVSSFKQVAVTHNTDAFKALYITKFIKDVIDSIKTKFQAYPYTFEVIGDETLNVFSKETPIHQILEHLVNNSVIHGFDPEYQGVISIVIKETPASIIIDYSDNGKGVPISIRSRIFDPFVTTRRGEGGSGLGMHVVYNLVTQALNGSIILAERENCGANFIIELPKDGGEN